MSNLVFHVFRCGHRRFGYQDGVKNAETPIPIPKDAKNAVVTAILYMNKPHGMYNMNLKPSVPLSSVLSSSLKMTAQGETRGD